MPTRAPRRPPDEQHGLSAKQAAFVSFYLLDFNATQAIIKAGYSAKVASQTGSRMLANAKVHAEIQRRKAALAARSEITRDWLVKELAAEFEEARKGTEVYDKQGILQRVTRRPEAVVRIGELIARMHGWTVDDKPGGTNQTLVNFVIQR